MDPVLLGRLFKSVSPGGVGVTRKQFANVKWAIGRLLDLMGLGTRRVKQFPLSAQWRDRVSGADDQYSYILLSRFGRYCSARKIEPSGVTDAIANEFRQSLELELRVADPRRTHRETVRMWNRLAASPGRETLQVLTLPSYSRRYVLSWDDLHPDLLKDMEGYLSKQATADPFDLSAPINELKASTIATYRDRLRRFASCLVLTGTDPFQLRSLADLVQMEAKEDCAISLTTAGRNPSQVSSASFFLRSPETMSGDPRAKSLRSPRLPNGSVARGCKAWRVRCRRRRGPRSPIS